jgi:hypothetical protein
MYGMPQPNTSGQYGFGYDAFPNQPAGTPSLASAGMPQTSPPGATGAAMGMGAGDKAIWYYDEGLLLTPEEDSDESGHLHKKLQDAKSVASHHEKVVEGPEQPAKVVSMLWSDLFLRCVYAVLEILQARMLDGEEEIFNDAQIGTYLACHRSIQVDWSIFNVIALMKTVMCRLLESHRSSCATAELYITWGYTISWTTAAPLSVPMEILQSPKTNLFMMSSVSQVRPKFVQLRVMLTVTTRC